MLRNKKLLAVIAVILLLIVGYFAYMLITDNKKAVESDDRQNTEETQQDNDKNVENDETNGEEESKIPEGWLEQTSTSFGYSIGVPDKWYYRFFGQTRMIGMDPNPIPEASEYAGMIVFTVDERPYDQMVNELKTGLESVSETENFVDSLTWLRIEGIISEEDIFHPGQMVIHAVISHEGNSYRLTYSSSKESYNENLETFNDVLETISFN